VERTPNHVFQGVTVGFLDVADVTDDALHKGNSTPGRKRAKPRRIAAATLAS
jgi:hypothetical protein